MKFYQEINGKRYLFVVGITKNLNIWMAIDGTEVKKADIGDAGIACVYKIYDDYWKKEFGESGEYATVFHWSAKKLEAQRERMEYNELLRSYVRNNIL